MLTTIRAKFTNGAIAPLEPIDIPEGANISVTIDVKPNLSTKERMKLARSAAGGWKDNSEYWDEMKRVIYESRNRGIDEGSNS